MGRGCGRAGEVKSFDEGMVKGKEREREGKEK